MYNGKTDLLILVYLHKWNMDAYFKKKTAKFLPRICEVYSNPPRPHPFLFFLFQKEKPVLHGNYNH